VSRYPVPIEGRFWRRIDSSAGADACWPWSGSVDQSGYGMVALDGHARRTHRVAYALAVGPIPTGMLVCHHCDNPPCCNPAHLFLGTLTDNNRDRANKGRSAALRGERNGNSKIADADAHVIRLRRASGARVSDLANEYGLNRCTVRRIANGSRFVLIERPTFAPLTGTQEGLPL